MMTRTLMIALSLTVAATPAIAAETDLAAIEVRTDDLNLAHSADRGRLDARLTTAARRVCQSGMRGAAEQARKSACVSEVLANAERQADRAVARAQGGTTLALLMLKAAR